MTASGSGLTLDDLVAAIAELSPAQRRALARRLRAGGLWDADELVADRNRLAVAPAVPRRGRRVTKPVKPAAAEEEKPAPKPMGRYTPALPPTEAQLAFAKSEPQRGDGYRSAVSGKVVMGPPKPVAPLSPHDMAPLPGQAPEQPIVVIFDGGSRGNPGQGYGSYALRWPGQAQQIVQLRFGDRVTNNEAEYDTLIAALEAILQRLLDAGAAPSTARVEARGDSLLVINQVKGLWEVKEARLQARRDRARGLLEQFGAWQLIHHDREQSVQTLGH